MKHIYETLKSFNWNSFFFLKDYIKDEMNNPSERFIKSKIVEQSIEKVTDEYLKYIDQPGRYFQCRDNNIFIESKGKSGTWSNKITVRLVNGNGSNRQLLPDDYSQFILLHDNENIYFSDLTQLSSYMYSKNGNIELKILKSNHLLKPIAQRTSKLQMETYTSFKHYLEHSIENYFRQFGL